MVLRREDGAFVCPGAWGVTWEDLVELDHRNPALWEDLAEVFLTWCRRGWMVFGAMPATKFR